jgi:hypothetical protein
VKRKGRRPQGRGEKGTPFICIFVKKISTEIDQSAAAAVARMKRKRRRKERTQMNVEKFSMTKNDFSRATRPLEISMSQMIE